MVHYDNVARTLLERLGRYGSLSSADCSSATSSGSFGSKRSGRRSRLRLAGRKTLLDADGKRASVMSRMLMLADMVREEKDVNSRDAFQRWRPTRSTSESSHSLNGD